jgi:leucine dehydrogenase
MSDSMQDLIQNWDGLSVILRYDEPSKAWFFIALHDGTLGPPTGGCRMRVYPRPTDGLLDALRLARGMTLKFAGAGLEYGGGKSVIALSRPLEDGERTGTLLRFGHLLESLRGAYWTGEDLGTTPQDMATIARASRYVHGIKRDPGGGEPVGAMDPGPYTAQGVLAGIRATAHHIFGSRDLAGRTVLVQGVGDVGGPLVRLLAEAGARVLVSDLDEARAREVARVGDGAVVPPEEVYRTDCDLFAPCAVGAILNQETIPQLRCRGVAGAANNQLADEAADGERLRDRGIVHAPDFLVSAGGALGLIYRARGHSEEEIRERIDQIEASVRTALAEAAARDEAPQWAAERRVLASLRERADPGSPGSAT